MMERGDWVYWRRIMIFALSVCGWWKRKRIVCINSIDGTEVFKDNIQAVCSGETCTVVMQRVE